MAFYKKTTNEDLKNFKGIVNRKDFNYICDVGIIENVNTIILYGVKEDKGNKEIYIGLLEKYLFNFKSFVNFICIKDEETNKKLNGSYALCNESLSNVIYSLKLPIDKREAISKGYLNKFSSNFLTSLKLLYDTVRHVFDEFIGQSSINRDQVIRYLKDSNVGVSRYFDLTSIEGRFEHFDLPDLSLVTSLLRRGPQRRYNRWDDYGAGVQIIRLLGVGKKIYYLFHNQGAEKLAYEAVLEEGALR